jgi:hypothetical protein
MTINWREIAKTGLPQKEQNYLVTDGKDVSVAYLDYSNEWTPDQNVCLDYSSGDGTQVVLDLFPTHYCPLSELNLPTTK